MLGITLCNGDTEKTIRTRRVSGQCGGPGVACQYMISPPLLLLTNTRCDTTDYSLAALALVERRITQLLKHQPAFSSVRGEFQH